MTESEAKVLTHSGDIDPANRRPINLTLVAPPLLVLGVDGPPPLARRRRAKSHWSPTERERAILTQPLNLKNMRQYCAALDKMNVLFPAKWQKRGWPKSHLEAWDSKDDRLQNALKSERANVIARCKSKG